MLNELRQKNEQLIAWFKGEQNYKAVERQELLKTMLTDDACFFKLDVSEAMSILKDLGYPIQSAISMYESLTSPDAYTHVKHLIAA